MERSIDSTYIAFYPEVFSTSYNGFVTARSAVSSGCGKFIATSGQSGGTGQDGPGAEWRLLDRARGSLESQHTG